MKSVPNQSNTCDPATLDLGSIPGVQAHYHDTGALPILVLREARSIQVVVSPFPGTWKLASPQTSRSLIPGRNTFPEPMVLRAGDELLITPLMSAVAPTGPRVQIPALLANDIGELETLDDLTHLDEVSLSVPDDSVEAQVQDVFSWDEADHSGGDA